MFERELAKERAILKIRSGSHLYGTNTPTSDEDFVGIFVPTPEYIVGLKSIEEVDVSIKSKDAAGKNTNQAVDCKYYTLKKFVTLAMQGNPNIIEILFVNQGNVVETTSVGDQLLKMNKTFVSKLIKNRFLGYAFSQKHKMVIKLENYEVLVEASKYLENCSREYIVEIVEVDHHPLFVKKKDHVSVGDLNMPITSTVKKAKAFVDNRLGQFGSRQELVTRFGYDTKFASHLIRLIVEGIELMRTGELVFPLREAPLLRAIRNGEHSMGDVLKMADEYEKEIENIYKETRLPAAPDFSKVEQFVMSVHMKGLSSYP